MRKDEENLPDAIPSMTLHVTKNDAQLVLKASEALKVNICSLQRQRTEKSAADKEKEETEGSTKRVVSPENDLVNSEDGLVSPLISSLHEIILEASKLCENLLLQAFISELTRQKFVSSEIQACLFFFVDGDF